MLSIGFIPPLVVFLAVLVTMAVLGFARPGRRVYLIGGIVLLLFVALNLPFAVEGLIDPIGSSHAWTDIIAIVVGIIGGIAGIAAFVALRVAGLGFAPWVLRSGKSWRSSSPGSSSGPAMSPSGGTASWKARPASGWRTAS